MKNQENKKCGTCHSCAYKRNITGDAHISCAFDWKKSKNKPPQANSHGIKSGWYMFPVNFDPVWQTSPCEEFSTEQDNSMVLSQDDIFMNMIVAMFNG